MKVSHKFLVITALCISVQAFADEKLSVRELLDKYAENQDKMKSFIARTEVVWKPSTENTSDRQPQQIREKNIAEVRYEDTGRGFKAYYCRTPYKLKTNGTWVEEDVSKSHKYLRRDGLYYQYYKGPRLAVSKLYVTSDPKYAGKEQLVLMDGVGPLLGFLYGDRDRIDSILRQSDSLSVRPGLERVGPSRCYVIDAVSRHGTYTVWLDPEHGYGIAKAIVRKGLEDLRWGRPSISYINPIEHSTDMLQNVRFKQVSDIWFPIEYEWMSTDEYEEKTISGCSQYKVIYLDVHPDHNTLESFNVDRLNIQEGTRVKIVGEVGKTLGVEHTWRTGMKFAVDDWDGRIHYIPKNWSMQVGMGKSLPEFEDIDLNITAEETRGKAILLCFFNIKQRPSRNCLLQLAIRAKELEAKEMTIVGVQVSKIDENNLRKWIEVNDIPFLVGIVRGDEKKAQFTWGVRSLPWLILADKKHIVINEGLNLAELDKKLSSIHSH